MFYSSIFGIYIYMCVCVCSIKHDQWLVKAFCNPFLKRKHMWYDILWFVFRAWVCFLLNGYPLVQPFHPVPFVISADLNKLSGFMPQGGYTTKYSDQSCIQTVPKVRREIEAIGFGNLPPIIGMEKCNTLNDILASKRENPTPTESLSVNHFIDQHHCFHISTALRI